MPTVTTSVRGAARTSTLDEASAEKWHTLTAEQKIRAAVSVYLGMPLFFSWSGVVTNITEANGEITATVGGSGSVARVYNQPPLGGPW